MSHVVQRPPVANSAAAAQHRPPSAQTHPPRRRPINRDELSNMPEIVTRDEMVRYCNDVLGVAITPTKMRRGLERRELTVWKLRGVNATSPQALYDWIVGMARPAVNQDGAA